MTQQINLFNPALFKQRNLLSAENLFFAFLSVLLLVALSVIYINYQTKKVSNKAKLVSQQLLEMEQQLKQFQGAMKVPMKDVLLAQELRERQKDVESHQRIMQLLRNNNLGNTDGYSEYLSAFARQIPQGVWITGFNLQGAGDDITIQGRSFQADMVPQYVTQLKREKIMQGKTFAVLQMQRPTIEIPSNVVVDEKKKNELAPYLEFEMHSFEAKSKADTGTKTQ